MLIYQSTSFARKAKKFTVQEKLDLDKEIQKLIQNPALGEEKKGDLKGIFVHKCTIAKIQYLIAYQLASDTLELMTIRKIT